MMTELVMLDKQATAEDLGFIPSFLDSADPRPAAQQLDANYQHGGGWWPLPGFTLDRFRLKYPGDQPLNPLAMILIRNEIVLLYPYDYVAVLQPGGAFEVCRMPSVAWHTPTSKGV